MGEYKDRIERQRGSMPLADIRKAKNARSHQRNLAHKALKRKAAEEVDRAARRK